MQFKYLWTTAAALAALGAAPSAQAAYPEKAITIVVGYAAGGTTDILARALAEQLGKSLKQSIVIENKPGAAGNIAAAAVEKAAADGYTLFITTVASHGINPALYKGNLGYRPIEGFAPISMIASIPLLLVANPALPVRSVSDLVEMVRGKPGQLNYASSGNGSPVHLAGAMFSNGAKLDVVHVPYRGGALANTSVMSGETQYTFATMPAAMPQVKAGKLRALAVTTRERSSQLPDVPTVGEDANFPGYEINTWNALLAPAGTPPEVVARVNQAVAEALSVPALRARFEREGATTSHSTPAELKTFIEAEMRKWAEVVDRIGVRIQ